MPPLPTVGHPQSAISDPPLASGNLFYEQAGQVAQISIPGASGSPTVTLTVTGNSGLNLATDFSRDVANASVVIALSAGGQPSTVAGALNLISSSATTSYSLTTPGQYTYASVSAPTTISGSSGHDTLLGGGGVSYIANGGNNQVTFTEGNNVFYGAAAGGNTIAGGAGHDIINAGEGSATVYSGSGGSLINLDDTSGGDIVALLTGNTTVNAFGANDTVYATTAVDPSTTGTIFGGSGILTFVGGDNATPLPITILGGSGTTNMFGGQGSDIVFANTSGAAVFVAGTGNETLNAANAAGGFAFFGNSNPGDADTVVGGTGNDFFSTGSGAETFFAGSGAALFQVNEQGAGTNITIANFGPYDSVNFAGLTVAQETSLLATASTLSNGNLTVTLDDGTKVDFLSVSSLAGHLT